jgi:hypothetical protein
VLAILFSVTQQQKYCSTFLVIKNKKINKMLNSDISAYRTKLSITLLILCCVVLAKLRWLGGISEKSLLSLRGQSVSGICMWCMYVYLSIVTSKAFKFLVGLLVHVFDIQRFYQTNVHIQTTTY